MPGPEIESDERENVEDHLHLSYHVSQSRQSSGDMNDSMASSDVGSSTDTATSGMWTQERRDTCTLLKETCDESTALPTSQRRQRSIQRDEVAVGRWSLPEVPFSC